MNCPDSSNYDFYFSNCETFEMSFITTPAVEIIDRKYVLSNTTEGWNSFPELVGKENYIYVYTDYKTVDNVNVPGLKIGDGTTLLADLPFVDSYVEGQLVIIYDELALKAPINSPEFTGEPSVPDITDGSLDSQIANKGYVDSKIIAGNFMVRGIDYVTAGRKPDTSLGTKATAEGNGNTSSGYTSHTEGANNTASGNSAHAEGQLTQATGGEAHAEGFRSLASGDYSHAEGNGTGATGNSSHAEGAGTSASEYTSHAEGNSTQASAWGSHAEGDSTVASGQSSHAEGYKSTASHSQSHAEGNDTLASGAQSHAEGFRTIAQRQFQHVFGAYNIADTDGANPSVKGAYVEIVGNGLSNDSRSNARTLDWNGNEILAGKLTVGTQPTNNNDVTTKKYVDDIQSDLLGDASADYNTLGKLEDKIIDINSKIPTEATSENQLADKSYVNFQISAGNFMVKGVDYVTAGKKADTTLGTKATAEGNNNTASGNYSHAEGNVNVVSGASAHVEGGNNTASGIAAHAEGGGTGSYSGNTASGVASHAEGGYGTASGDYSHSEGYASKSIGYSSHAQGLFTTANHKSQFTFGEYNILDTSANAATDRGDYVEIVGNGTSSSARSNARTLDWSGNEVLAGKLTVGAAPTVNMDVTTKGYVDTALALKANIASPTFTGSPKAPTTALTDNSTNIATTAFVQGNIVRVSLADTNTMLNAIFGV